jgi:hypothetical protein
MELCYAVLLLLVARTKLKARNLHIAARLNLPE